MVDVPLLRTHFVPVHPRKPVWYLFGPVAQSRWCSSLKVIQKDVHLCIDGGRKLSAGTGINGSQQQSPAGIRCPRCAGWYWPFSDMVLIGKMPFIGANFLAYLQRFEGVVHWVVDGKTTLKNKFCLRWCFPHWSAQHLIFMYICLLDLSLPVTLSSILSGLRRRMNGWFESLCSVVFRLLFFFTPVKINSIIRNGSGMCFRTFMWAGAGGSNCTSVPHKPGSARLRDNDVIFNVQMWCRLFAANRVCWLDSFVFESCGIRSAVQLVVLRFFIPCLGSTMARMVAAVRTCYGGEWQQILPASHSLQQRRLNGTCWTRTAAVFARSCVFRCLSTHLDSLRNVAEKTLLGLVFSRQTSLNFSRFSLSSHSTSVLLPHKMPCHDSLHYRDSHRV